MNKPCTPSLPEFHQLARRPMAGTGRLVLASLLWLPQAALLALAVQSMADGAGVEPLWPLWQLAAGVALLGGLRAWCDASGTRRANLQARRDRKSTRLNSSHSQISYAVFCLKKKKKT